MPATKTSLDIGAPALSWQQLRGWINSNARDLFEIAEAGYLEKGRGLLILAGSAGYPESELAIKCRYIMPEEIADIRNEALDLAQELVTRYDPEIEFVVVTIDATNHITSARVAVGHPTPKIVH
ncbi:MAG: hypothetical protein J4N76_01560 [Chloroflexi bacterium]|nr:hypothetical protein [Chloroflexota bacterium]MCI0853875.1 hypothetical protein [Chloroflexota bacterium]MCI0875235.1 hypothetical protein [Chloroflexota bacterium]